MTQRSDCLAAIPHHPLLLGRQSVAALWFPADGGDGLVRAHRILENWRTGATLLHFPQGDLLRFATPVAMQCELQRGWPLRWEGGTLCSATLTPAEAVAIPLADVWLVYAGQISPLYFGDAQRLDVSRWLAVDGMALHDTFEYLADLPAAVELAPVLQRDMRDVLNHKVPAASEAQRSFLQSLHARQDTDRAAGAARGLGGPGMSWTRWWPVVFIVLAVCAAIAVSRGDSNVPSVVRGILVLCFFYVLGHSARQSSGQSGATQAGRDARTLPQRGNSGVKAQAWRHWLARLTVLSQMSRVLGWRQAAYMRKMLDLFESGQMDEALRHAIPLGGDKPSLGQAFGTPGARNDLSLNRQAGASVGIHLGDALNNYLRDVYRRSFEKLNREGRIDEACFVLAELLNAQQEALDYLEKHQRYQQAAELALSWDRPPDVIVRLHCLAGDWRLAVAVARRDNAFANAVLQLESRWPDAAARLREEWARALALRGDWLGAVEVIWPIAALRGQAADWLVSAEAAGGELGARALVKRAFLLPDTWQVQKARLDALRDDPLRTRERAAVAQALLALKDSKTQVHQLTRFVLPSILRDQGNGPGLLSQKDLKQLVTLAADPWLLADLPGKPLPFEKAHDLHLAAPPVHGQCPEPGSLTILDAVALQDGQFLLALGEAGAVVVNAYGGIVARFAVPAQRIVIASSAQVALVLAQRGQVSRVSRIDLVLRRTTDLGVAELPYFATEFDGIAWTIGKGACLRVLDTQQSLQEVLWQVTDLPGSIRDLSVNGSVEQILLGDKDGNLELWRYALPARRLLARGEPLPALPENLCSRVLNPNGGVIDIVEDVTAEGARSLAYRLHTRTFPLGVGLEEEVLEVTGLVRDSWLLLRLTGAVQCRFLLVSLGDGQVRAQVDWPSEAQPRMRLSAAYCLIFDTQGRLWTVDTTHSAVRSLSLR